MQKLNLPVFEFNIKEIDGQLSIFDINRKKFVVLTPEEWVRQNLVEFLVKDRLGSTAKQHPASLITFESAGGILWKVADIADDRRDWATCAQYCDNDCPQKPREPPAETAVGRA